MPATKQDSAGFLRASCPLVVEASLWLSLLTILAARQRAAKEPAPTRSAAAKSECSRGSPCSSLHPATRQRPAPAHRCQTRLRIHPRSHRLWPALHGQRESQETGALHPRPSERRPSKADEIEDDAFTADTVEGKFPVRNIIAKFPGTKDGIIVILGHYDTNYPLRNTGYVGANDGGSSTAILLEFANQLRTRAKSAMATASGWSGPTAKKPSRPGRTPTASTARVI